MSKPTYSSLCRQLLRYHRAVEGMAWMGSKPPNCHGAIQDEFYASERALQKAFMKLTGEQNEH